MNKLWDNFGKRRAYVAALSIVAGAIGGSGAAHAQTAVSKPFTIEVGAYSPSDSGTRDFSGDTHFEVGVNYDLGKTPGPSPFIYGVYFNYIAPTSLNYVGVTDFYDPYGNYAGSDVFSGTGTTSAYALGIQGRYLLTQDRSMGRHGGGGYTPYIGAGVGYYDSFFKDEGVDQSEGYYYYSHQEGGLGGKLELGVQSHSGFMGELSYQWFPGNEGVNMSGTGINVGYRF